MLPMYPTIESGEQFAVVNVVTEDDTYEIATFREDVYNKVKTYLNVCKYTYQK